MALTIALNAATLGLSKAEKQIAIVAGNINNADKAGYTRKVLQSQYSSTGLISLPYGGISVQAVSDPLLVKQVNTSSTLSSNQATLSTFLTNYSQSLGSTSDGALTLSSSIDTLNSALQILEQNPSDTSAKVKVITTAQTVTSTLNAQAQQVQTARSTADAQIGTNVTTINQSLQSIYLLNKQIGAGSASGQGIGDLEDERNQALLSLSQQMNIQYFKDSHDQVSVYTTGGSSLVSAGGAATLSYSPVGQVTSATVYPGGFSGIMLNGADVTNSIDGGNIGALVQLRDTILPGEQAKLDQLTTVLKQTVNESLNSGTSYPPLQTVTGMVGVNSGTPLSGTGNLQVALTDSTGTLQSTTSLDISSYATVGDLVTALNGISGISASVASGTLVVSATSASSRIAFNPQNTDIGGISATQFFGFNDLFTNNPAVALNASTIQVNANLLSNPDALATATLSTTAAVGGSAIAEGDNSTVTALVTNLNSSQSFAAAGDFGSRSMTLSAYSNAIISGVASRAAAAKLNSDTASAAYSYLSDNLSNETGVNIDEETANLTVLQGNYQANAQLISTVKDLFQALIQAVS